MPLGSVTIVKNVSSFASTLSVCWCMMEDVGFGARHPWYRVPHKHIPIEYDETADYAKKQGIFKITKGIRC